MSRTSFAAYLAPLWNKKWVVYCKHPFGGPEEVLRYLARYTHRVAISNRRLIASDAKGVTFKWKDYRIKGPERYKLMTLPTHEFIRRFLMHVLPAGFHRIRYYGLLASGKRAENVARVRELLAPPIIPVDAIKAVTTNAAEAEAAKHSCPCCGGRMIIIERFERGATPHHQPSRHHQRSGSTPHDVITAAQTLSHSFLLVHSRSQPSSHSSSQFANNCTRNRSQQPTARSFAPTYSSSR